MTDETQPVKGTPHPTSRPAPAAAAAPPPADQPADQPRPSRLARLRSRAGAVGRGTVVALVAGLVVGSAGGFAVGAVALGPDRPDHHQHGPGQVGRPFDGDGDADRPMLPPSGSQQMPPSTAPEEQSEDGSSSDLNG